MATTSQQSDFDRVKRWGKEFLAAGQAGTGQGQSRSDATAGPQGDAGEMTARTTQFNPPPGWPPAPAGWVAPPGWQPDPSWPEPRRWRKETVTSVGPYSQLREDKE